MKIGCEHCGAAYAVRDDKVAGRKLKLRCKRCGEPITVDARDLEVEEEAAAPESQPGLSPAPAPLDDLEAEAAEGVDDEDYGGDVTPLPVSSPTPLGDADAVWYLAVDEQTQGPYTAAELSGMLGDGSAAADLMCWREGLADWRPLGETPEIAGIAVTPARPPAAPVPSFADHDPFAEAVEPPSIGRTNANEIEEAARDPRLSAQQIMSSQSAGTVQFSMDEIRALSGASSPAPMASMPTSVAPGHASGDSSGLIDMRALAAMEQSVGEELPSEEPRRTPTGVPLDSLAPIQLTPLAPLPSPRDDGFRTRVLAGVTAFGFVLAAGVAVFAILQEPAAPVEVAAAAATAPVAAPVAEPAPAATPEPAAAAEEAQAEPEEEAQAEATENADEEQGDDATDATDATDEADEAATKPAKAKDAPRKRSKAKTTRSNKPERRAKASEKPRAKERAKGGDDLDDIMNKPAKSSSEGSIDDLLLAAVRGGGKNDKGAKKGDSKKDDAPKAKADSLPKTPSRDDMLSALSSVKKKVQNGCSGGGVATAAITIKNNGRVSGVKVSGVSGASKSCVERAVKGARFPKFSQPTFQVKFPFKLKG